MARITEPVHDHAKRSGCLAVPWTLFGLLMLSGLVFYGIPAAWAEAVASGDWLTFVGAFFLALVVLIFFGVIGVLYVADAITKDRFANECDKHTFEIDGEWHLSHDGSHVPGRLYVIDHQKGEVRAEWYDRKGRFHKAKVEDLSLSEMIENDLIAHYGGLGSVDYRW